MTETLCGIFDRIAAHVSVWRIKCELATPRQCWFWSHQRVRPETRSSNKPGRAVGCGLTPDRGQATRVRECASMAAVWRQYGHSMATVWRYGIQSQGCPGRVAYATFLARTGKQIQARRETRGDILRRSLGPFLHARLLLSYMLDCACACHTLNCLAL